MEEKKFATAREVLNNVNRLLDEKKSFKIDDVYKDLSIFDWWKDKLSFSDLNQMRIFLEHAIRFGYTGYVCFKVGVAGCSHGMWAYKKESETGYSPDGEVLFHSFREKDCYWDMKLANGKWLHEVTEGKSDFTFADIKRALVYQNV